MCVCVCFVCVCIVCVCACMCMCLCVCVQWVWVSCVCECMCVRVYVLYMWVSCACKCECGCLHAYVCVCVCVWASVHACMQSHKVPVSSNGHVPLQSTVKRAISHHVICHTSLTPHQVHPATNLGVFWKTSQQKNVTQSVYMRGA